MPTSQSLAIGVLSFATFLPLLGHAEDPVRLSDDDVYFQFSGITNAPGLSRNVSKPSNNRLCGFEIRGNHRSRANPHIEWDLNIDEIVTPDRSVAGVSAGSFEVTDHKRIPRAAITGLSFLLKEGTDPIVAQIHGSPNRDNGIVALIEREPASRLFSEFQTIRPIVISMHYADGTADAIQVRGYRDNRKFGGGKNSYFNECLRGFSALPGGLTTQVP